MKVQTRAGGGLMGISATKMHIGSALLGGLAMLSLPISNALASGCPEGSANGLALEAYHAEVLIPPEAGVENVSKAIIHIPTKLVEFRLDKDDPDLNMHRFRSRARIQVSYDPNCNATQSTHSPPFFVACFEQYTDPQAYKARFSDTAATASIAHFPERDIPTTGQTSVLFGDGNTNVSITEAQLAKAKFQVRVDDGLMNAQIRCKLSVQDGEGNFKPAWGPATKLEFNFEVVETYKEPSL
jgi:hypothetical protein